MSARGLTCAIVDAAGEIVAVVTGTDAAIERNTPPGHLAIKEVPPAPDAYRVGAKWVLRPVRPTSGHTWDSAGKQWRDERPLDVVKRDLVAPLLQRLADEDVRAIRPLAELVDSLLKGQAPDVDSRAALAGLLARKEALRAQLLQISAAGDAAALGTAAAETSES
jgi:hypothetical protein